MRVIWRSSAPRIHVNVPDNYMNIMTPILAVLLTFKIQTFLFAEIFFIYG